MSNATYTPIHVPKRGLDMATMQQQLDLEYLMLQSGIDRYNKQLNDMVGKDLSSKTLHGRAIISGVCEPLADAIAKLTKTKRNNRDISYKLLQGIKPEQAAFLTLISVVDKDEGGSVTAVNEGSYIEELDITLTELNDETIQSLGLDPETAGVFVEKVGEKNTNLLPNDVIIQVSSDKIQNLSSFEKMISDSVKLERDKLLLRVIRDGSEFWLINPFVE